MPDYIVLFDTSPLASSDAAVGGEHVENTTITSEVLAAKVAFVSAETPAAAEQVVYEAYNGSSNYPVVLAAEAVQEVERPTVPVDEPEASTEPNAAPVDEPVRDEDTTGDTPEDTDTTDSEATEPTSPESDTAEQEDAFHSEGNPVKTGEPVTVEPVE